VVLPIFISLSFFTALHSAQMARRYLGLMAKNAEISGDTKRRFSFTGILARQQKQEG